MRELVGKKSSQELNKIVLRSDWAGTIFLILMFQSKQKASEIQN
jgi:hypothetical protein